MFNSDQEFFCKSTLHSGVGSSWQCNSFAKLFSHSLIKATEGPFFCWVNKKKKVIVDFKCLLFEKFCQCTSVGCYCPRSAAADMLFHAHTKARSWQMDWVHPERIHARSSKQLEVKNGPLSANQCFYCITVFKIAIMSDLSTVVCFCLCLNLYLGH